MRVVLLGAGASFGSGTVLPRVPPLGFDLFPALQRLYQTWRSIPEKEAVLFKEDFEAGMAEVVEKYGMAVAPLMQEMAMFFSVFGLKTEGRNRYRTLIKAVVPEQAEVIWSTLNYECLLEHAAILEGLKVGYFSEPGAEADTLPVWKLHGSCNFNVTGLAAGRGVKFGTAVVFSGNIEPINPSDVIPTYSGNTALYPAMALFAEGKAIAMSPEPIKQAQESWAEAIRVSDRIAVVGVNPNVADDHIWAPLSVTEGEIGYVGASGRFEEWSAKYRSQGNDRVLGGTWAEAEDELISFLTK